MSRRRPVDGYYYELEEFDKFLENLGGWSLIFGIPVTLITSGLIWWLWGFLMAVPTLIVVVLFGLVAYVVLRHTKRKYPHLFVEVEQ